MLKDDQRAASQILSTSAGDNAKPFRPLQRRPIVIIALRTMLGGGEDCFDITFFGQAREPFLRQFLNLEHDIPSHHTFSRVLRLLDPVAFAACSTRFMQRFSDGLTNVVAIAGKSSRRSFDRAAGQSPLHMLHA